MGNCFSMRLKEDMKIVQVRKYNKDDFCKKCRHLKETVRIRIDKRIARCNCTGPCGCFVCLICGTIPCSCNQSTS